MTHISPNILNKEKLLKITLRLEPQAITRFIDGLHRSFDLSSLVHPGLY